MWSEIPAVKVATYRMLKKLGNQDSLDMMYLEDEEKAWADAGISAIDDSIVHKDSNGVILQAGDTVTIIKDLEVKGAGFTAKRGTAVRNISLTSNPEQIEGRVNGVKIVLLTCFLKKS
jgi:protein PhnA